MQQGNKTQTIKQKQAARETKVQRRHPFPRRGRKEKKRLLLAWLGNRGLRVREGWRCLDRLRLCTSKCSIESKAFQTQSQLDDGSPGIPWLPFSLEVPATKAHVRSMAAAVTVYYTLSVKGTRLGSTWLHSKQRDAAGQQAFEVRVHFAYDPPVHRACPRPLTSSNRSCTRTRASLSEKAGRNSTSMHLNCLKGGLHLRLFLPPATARIGWRSEAFMEDHLQP